MAKVDPNIIKALNTLSEENQMKIIRVVNTSGLTHILKYIKNPSEKVQLEAVKKNGYAIQYIKNPSEKVQLEAIRKNSGAIDYIKNPTPKVKALYKKLYY